MVKSGFHGMWPKHEGILLYPFEDVKRKIAAPQARKRGASAVPDSISFGESQLRFCSQIIKLFLITVLRLFTALLRPFAVNLY